MSGFAQKDYKIFELFSCQLALVTAGRPDSFNSCTIGWGSMGTIWSKTGHGRPVITVYVYPSRYTCEYLKSNGTFTVSFFPREYRKALIYMGTHSGRRGDKAEEAGLTPVPMGDSVTYRQADLVFLCKKLYQHAFAKEDLAVEIGEFYRANPAVYPPDENGDWQTHYMFVGEITDVWDTRDGAPGSR